MRIAFLLPGMHRVNRGAEVAFEAVASGIAGFGTDAVTVFGSGPARPDAPYRYVRAPMISRERFERLPTFPPFRVDTVYEEATWTAAALTRYRPREYDVTVTCSFPFVHWMAARWPPFGRHRPAHVFVTQNGDHPAYAGRSEYRTFRCDGLVCTNPLYYEEHRDHWRSTLIPNGIDPQRFRPGPSCRAELGLPEGVPLVLIASALIESKRVIEGMEAVAPIADAHLVVAGDGPLRAEFESAGGRLMPGRFHRMVLPPARMPDLYRSVDVLLHPTLMESFGNIYIEAMAAGVPVVAHNTHVTRWILGETQLLVDTRDTAATTAAVRTALAQGPSADRVDEVHERFAWSTVARSYREFFAEVVDAASDECPPARSARR